MSSIEVKIFQDIQKDLYDNLQEIRNWVSQKELKKDQLISINVVEDSVALNRGISNLVVLFKKTSSDPAATPVVMDNECFSYNPWDTLFAKAIEELKENNKEVFSLQQCSKSVGLKNQQVLFSTPHANNPVYYNVKTLEHAGDWTSFAKMVADWCNSFIAPHQFVSLCVFENQADIKATEHIRRCSIIHTGSAQDTKLPESGEGAIYKLHFIEKDSKATWEVISADVIKHIDSLGDEVGVQVSLCNNATGDGKVAVVLSYDNNRKEVLEAAMRPLSCCTIF